MLYVILGALLIAGAATWYGKHQSDRADALDVQLTVANKEIEKLAGVNKVCKADVDTQNKEVQALKKAGEERAAKAAEEVDAARREANKWRVSAGRIADAKPVDPNDLCKSFEKELNAYIRARKGS